MAKPLTTLLLLGIGLMLQACYEDVGVSLHKPHVYKGQNDPLLAKLKTQDWQTKLEERFKLGATDR